MIGDGIVQFELGGGGVTVCEVLDEPPHETRPVMAMSATAELRIFDQEQGPGEGRVTIVFLKHQILTQKTGTPKQQKMITPSAQSSCGRM